MIIGVSLKCTEVSQIRNNTPTIGIRLSCASARVDAIELFQEQLASLNAAVEDEVRAILRNQAALPATLAIILPFLIFLFYLFVHSRYPRTALHLPLDQCVLTDATRQRQLGREIDQQLEDMYKQPAMAERAPLEPDYAGLSSDPDPDHQLSSPPAEEADLESDQRRLRTVN